MVAAKKNYSFTFGRIPNGTMHYIQNSDLWKKITVKEF
jgi:hypothetical protein